MIDQQSVYLGSLWDDYFLCMKHHICMNINIRLDEEHTFQKDTVSGQSEKSKIQSYTLLDGI